MEDFIQHYGTPRHSGRYPYGSGENPYQHEDFLKTVKDLQQKGKTEKEIADILEINTTQLRARKTAAIAAVRQSEVNRARALSDKGYSPTEIGKLMGKNESSVRSLLDPTIEERSNILKNTTDALKKEVADKKYIDIGPGTEYDMNISRTKLKTAVQMMVDEGYTKHYVQIEQLGTGLTTTITVLAAPDTPYSEVYKNKDKISLVGVHSEDGGRTYLGLKPIQNINSDRVAIRYAEDGGTEKDGLIEIRRGTEDINMGRSRYSQVRIGVDGTHYLKGMAVYSDDLPDGVDVLFNTNKSKSVSKMDVLKPQKDDPDNPFGAAIKANGQKGALNIVNEEGDWAKWDKSLASQFLSKQPIPLVKKQLNLSYAEKLEEFETIKNVSNPILKKKLLQSFADDCDASAVNLKGAAMPRQQTHVILPFSNIKENEIYAPNYRDGEEVIAIRYPHGGVFEIPRLIVNNKNKLARDIIGTDAVDAVGINSKTAKILSGADFDGDSVLIIPTKGNKIKTSNPLKGLEDFDPQASYPAVPGMKSMGKKGGTKEHNEMGNISNLITDMTIGGAGPDEIARAVRHSMVVIDAAKHNLNYEQSYIDNGIAQLKEKYQGGKNRGASTLISKASSEQRVAQRKQGYKIDPETGAKIFEETGATYTDQHGKTQLKTTKSTKMYEADDAYSLSSGKPIENVYADYANKLKSLGNTARKEIIATKPIPMSQSAKKTYSNEVASLKSKLLIALKNAPLERRAQLIANTQVASRKRANKDMTGEELKKIKAQSLAGARIRVGAHKQRIKITPSEWAAIQSGAVSNNLMREIFDNTDLDLLKEYAMPRSTTSLSPAKINRAKAMSESGYTQAEIADALGISTSTLRRGLEGDN